jgi:hypothetical protein
MAYRRPVAATCLLRGEELTAAMAGIGMRFAATPMADADLEETLVAASIEALEHDDHRVLAVLMTWLHTHHPRVNADRLVRAVGALGSDRVRAFWASVGRWLSKDRRFARLCELYHGQRIDLLPVGTAFHVQRAGEDARFAGAPLRVPANVLRDRAADVLAPADLARRHRTYRQRVLMGPTYRADMWAALEQNPSLTAAELARRTHGSFATAWQVKHDHALLGAAAS